MRSECLDGWGSACFSHVPLSPKVNISQLLSYYTYLNDVAYIFVLEVEQFGSHGDVRVPNSWADLDASCYERGVEGVGHMCVSISISNEDSCVVSTEPIDAVYAVFHDELAHPLIVVSSSLSGH